MPQVMTLEEFREYVRSMPDDEILKITIEFKEDSHERDDRKRDEAIYAERGLHPPG